MARRPSWKEVGILPAYDRVRYRPAGDRAVLAEFGDGISLGVNRRVRAMAQEIEVESLPGVVEWLPSYRALLVYYDPLRLSHARLLRTLAEIEARLDEVVLPSPRVFTIPTLYGGEHGPDLEDVVSYTGLSADEVIRTHSRLDYHVYFTGFTPGFLYLGGMAPSIATPRLENPRIRIPAGSVGIAGNQTGAYPIESPGGWRLIGRTPVRLYDPDRAEPVLIRAGDVVRFRPIDSQEYEELEQRIRSGQYVIEVESSSGGEAAWTASG